MRKRITLVGVVALCFGVLAGSPAFAHHADDEDQYEGVVSKQYTDFQSTATNAAEESNAPMSFAPCDDGMAAGMFPCDGIDMMSFIPHGDLGTTFANDMWGWTDPATGQEYALLGAGEGTVFVDITDAKRPDVLGILPTQTSDNFFWRDIKVFEDHAFIVSEDNGHGMQVFDLTQLRDWDGTYTFYENTAHYDGINSAHNIAINEDTGFAYAVGVRGTGSCDGGLHMIDISDPANPTFAGCFGDNGYVHDAQCVIYEGPDARYQGHEICFNSNAVGAYGSSDHFVDIVDVTDKESPVSIGRSNYPNAGYSHQGWLTPDQQFFLHGDEGDEVIHGLNTTTRVWDMTDLENPTLLNAFENDTTSIDHNIYTKGRLSFHSNYSSGLRVYDNRNIADGELSELAYFDVHPDDDDADFEFGTWGNYPYFDGNVVAATGMERGLFILRVRTGLHNN